MFVVIVSLALDITLGVGTELNKGSDEEIVL